MGTYHYAHLAYGYDLGSDESPQIEETGEFGSPDVEWMKRDDEGYVDESLDAAVVRRLYEAIPDHDPSKTEQWQQENAVDAHYGVQVMSHGWGYEGQASYALVADKFTVEGGESEVLDPAKLVEVVERDGLDQKLDHALTVLAGLTPTRPRGWTLMADR